MYKLEAERRRLGPFFWGSNRFRAVGKVAYSVCVPIALNSSGIAAAFVGQLKAQMPICTPLLLMDPRCYLLAALRSSRSMYGELIRSARSSESDT